MPSAESIASQFADQQGWTDSTLLDLCLTYIDRQTANDAFADYLRGIATEENDPGRCPLCGGPMVDTEGDGVFFCAADCQEPTDEDDRDPCLRAGEHVSGSDHRWQECPTYHDDDEDDGEAGEDLYQFECAHCGRNISGLGYDATGSRRCDDLDPEHRHHRPASDTDQPRFDDAS